MEEKRSDYPLIVERLATVEEHIKSIDGKLDTVVETVHSINERCFQRTPAYTLLEKHLSNGEKKADRQFSVTEKILTGIALLLCSAFISAIMSTATSAFIYGQK